MNINLANIDFCPGEGGGTPSEVKLAPTTAEILLTETEKVIVPPEGTDGFNKVTITHAPVEESVNTNITSNGTHTIIPSEGFGAMFGVNVDVNVPSKPEVAKDIVITENGNTTYTPNEGEVFNRVNVDVNVPIKTEVAKDITITQNGNTTYTPNEGEVFNSVSVDVNVPIKTEVAKDITITQNGNTTYTPNEGEVFNSVSVDVNVSSIDSVMQYSYRKPTADDAGLKAIGWTDDDVNYYKYNNYAYPGGDDNYKVGDANKEITINSVSDIAKYKNAPYFKYCPKFDTSNETGVNNVFQNCLYLTSIPQLDTRSVTNMSDMFRGCSSLTIIPPLDTSKVTSMYEMFISCLSLTIIPQLDTRSVTSMDSMFLGCISLTSIPQLDTSKVKNMSNMFTGCTALTSVSRLDATSLTNASSMFGNSYRPLNTFTTFGGLTGLKIDFDLSNCPNLTYESLLNVFNELADVTASPKTLTLGEKNLKKLWSEDKAIATNKGWTLK